MHWSIPDDNTKLSQRWKALINPSLDRLKERRLTPDDFRSLETYLTIGTDNAIPLPQCVIDLVQKSRERYKNQDSEVFKCTKKAYEAKAANLSVQLAPCGGKACLTGDKIDKIFGISEDAIYKSMKKERADGRKDIQDYFLWSNKEINELFNELQTVFSDNPVMKKVVVLGGVPVSALSRLPSGHNDANSIAMIPSASRHNTLEGKVRVSNYFPGVQGEQCVIESLALGMLRVAYVESQTEPNKFSVFDKFNEKDLERLKKFYHQGGLYLDGKWKNVIPTPEEKQKLLEIFQQNKDKLQFYAQWCPNDTINSNYLLYLLAGPVYETIPTDKGNIDLCTEILEGQYEATAKLAVILAACNPSKKVNLHLTLVGGGVFNNPRDTIYDSIKKAISLIPDNANINVYIHAFDPNEFTEASGKLNGIYNEAYEGGARFLLLNSNDL